MAVLALVSDLATQSRLSAAALRAGATIEFAGSLASLFEKISAADARVVIVDLSHPGLDVGELVTGVRAAAGAIPVLAFGPHVHKERLAAAEQAGCQLVLSRGAFHAEMDAILKRYAA